MWLLVAMLAVPGSVCAAELGTYTTSMRYKQILDSEGNSIWMQIHYPALAGEDGAEPDPGGGPYPLAAMIHGYMGGASIYDTACDAFASMGLVIVNMDTETHAWMDPYVLAAYTQVAMSWAETSSAEPGHWLQGMVSDDPWMAMGHSMGGISVALLQEAEPRLETVIGFSPYRDEDYEWDAYPSFTGAALMLTGNEDTTSPPHMVQKGWFEDLDTPSRGLFGVMHGTGHQAITDIEFEPSELTDAEQLEVSIELAGAFIEAQVFGVEDRYDTLLCTPPTPWDAQASRGSLPATSAESVSEAELRVGVAGQAGWTAVVYGGLGPGHTETEHGPIDLRQGMELTRVELPEGVACAGATLAEGYAGLAWVQVAFVDGDHVSLGRTIDVFGTGAEPLDTGDTGRILDSDPPAQDTGAQDSPPHDSAADDKVGPDQPSGRCGCGAGEPTTFFLLLAPALAMRRRRRDTIGSPKQGGVQA